MGWSEYFVRKGHPVYLTDQSGRGRDLLNRERRLRVEVAIGECGVREPADRRRPGKGDERNGRKVAPTDLFAASEGMINAADQMQCITSEFLKAQLGSLGGPD